MFYGAPLFLKVLHFYYIIISLVILNSHIKHIYNHISPSKSHTLIDNILIKRCDYMAENIYNYIREEIKKHRRLNQFTQQDLADKTSVSKQSISRIECGKLSPSLDTLYDLSDALNCSIYELLPRNNVIYDDSIDKRIAYKVSLCTTKQKEFIDKVLDAYLASENR